MGTGRPTLLQWVPDLNLSSRERASANAPVTIAGAVLNFVTVQQQGSEGGLIGLGKLNCLNQDKAVELLGGATRERERGWKEEERRRHTYRVRDRNINQHK